MSWEKAFVLHLQWDTTLMQHHDYSWHLNEDERAAAFSLWDALMFAPSKDTLEEARLKLKQATDIVQRAVMTAIASDWAQSKNTPREENPFTPAEQPTITPSPA